MFVILGTTRQFQNTFRQMDLQMCCPKDKRRWASKFWTHPVLVCQAPNITATYALNAPENAQQHT